MVAAHAEHVTGTMRQGMLRLLLALLFCVAATPAALAVDHIIVNSQDWRDVYTGMQYAQLTNVPANFLVSTKHSTILLYSIPVEREDILVLSSRDQPFIVGYEGILQSRGYASPQELRSSSLNLDLLERLEGVNRFIILDDAYGYNAISVAPFAAVDRSFVIFANQNNVDDIVSLLQQKNAEHVLIYGQVDRAVKDALAAFSPETINTGSRFTDNTEIVRRYLATKPTKQVILTNGEFIEAGIMSGADPVLFLGRQNVPETVRSFIEESDIEVGILIGNELVNSATFVRRQLGISVFVKFAQGARQPSGSIATVEDLDRFPMPRYDLNLEVTSIVYNKATKSLEVTYHNLQDLATYFKGTITVRDGERVWVLGDETPIFLDKSEYKTVVYSIDTDGNPLTFASDELSGDVFVIFGEGPQSLENTYQKTFAIDVIEVLDDAEIEIAGLAYDTTAKQFLVTIENVGEATVYASVELVDLAVNGESITVGNADSVKIAPGKKAKVPVEVELDEADFADNDQIRVRAYYGERELARIKIKEKTFPLTLTKGLAKYAVYGAIVLLALLLLFFLGTKKTCKHCGEKNARGRKTCLKCGRPFGGAPVHRGGHQPPGGLPPAR
jgi:archaellum component FlaF (FlaF/FlaG flagellin family)